MAGKRENLTVDLDEELLRAVKELARSTGRRDADVLEDALRRYLSTHDAERSRTILSDLLGQIDGAAPLSDQEALDLAYAELHSARRARREC